MSVAVKRKNEGNRYGSRILSAGAVVFLLVACRAKPKAESPGLSDCPSLGSADEIAAYDFAGSFHLPAKSADELKAALLAASDVTKLSDRLDADFGISCAQIALDLDQKGDYRTGRDACDAAVRGVQVARSRLGTKITPHLVAPKPVCQTDVNALTKCANVCDSSASAKAAKAECSVEVGRCDGTCDGTCEIATPRACDGTCAGTCEGAGNGVCGGRCKGKCNGKRSNGPCDGTCVGTCEAGPFEGTCKGKCAGTCEPKAPGTCENVCVGSCSVALSGAKCAGEFKAPEVSSACRARCELAALNQTECGKPRVGIVFSGKMNATEKENADRLTKAVDASFPSLFESLESVGGSRGTERVVAARDEIERVRANLQKKGAKAEADRVSAYSCFDDALKRAVDVAADVKLGIEQAEALREALSK